MTDYRIICTNQEPCNADKTKAHIVTVGTGEQTTNEATLLKLAAVIDAMKKGDKFHTIGTQSQKRAEVEPFQCGACNTTHIRSHKDATTDNNLDSLRTCRAAKKIG